MKRIYWILTSISLYSLLSCSNGAKDTREYQTVKTDTVVSAGGQTSLQYPGKVKAAQDISLAFRVSGTIQKIYVKDGARVQAGQLLAELDPTDYQVQLDATEAEYKQIKAEAERVMALYKDNGTTPSANDKAVYGLKQITAKYRHHKDQLGYTRLYAPFSGYIQKRLFEAHETVGAGMPVLSMISNSAPEVEINLPAAEYIRREQFDRYRCTFDIYPEQTYELKLISVTPKANANQLYTMRLQLITDNRPVPSPGMNTMVTILCNNDSSRNLSVPGSAVLQKRRQSLRIRIQPVRQQSTQPRSNPRTPAEQRTQHHRFRRAATRRPSGVGRNTSHKGRRNRDSSACCQRHKHRRTVIALFSFKTQQLWI